MATALLGCIGHKGNKKLGPKVYRKHIHMDHYLHKESNHHPSHKHMVIKIFMTRPHESVSSGISKKNYDNLTTPYK